MQGQRKAPAADRRMFSLSATLRVFTDSNTPPPAPAHPSRFLFFHKHLSAPLSPRFIHTSRPTTARIMTSPQEARECDRAQKRRPPGRIARKGARTAQPGAHTESHPHRGGAKNANKQAHTRARTLQHMAAAAVTATADAMHVCGVSHWSVTVLLHTGSSGGICIK